MNPDGTDSKASGFCMYFRSEKEAREAWKTTYPGQHPFFSELNRTSNLPDGRILIEHLERRECFGPYKAYELESYKLLK